MTGPLCATCAAGQHGEPCLLWVKTGRQVPDRDPYRDRTGWVPEWVRCGCGCSEPTVTL